MENPADSLSTSLEVCYEVLLLLAIRMQGLQPGDLLEFIAQDPNAADEIIPWVELREFELVSMEPLPNGQTRFLIRR